jgi:hypothetical protein
MDGLVAAMDTEGDRGAGQGAIGNVSRKWTVDNTACSSAVATPLPSHWFR